MKKGVVWLMLVAFTAAAGILLTVPSVRAQVGEVLRWFRFESPAGGGEVAVPGNAGFTPLRPTYLPAGFQTMAVGFNPEAASLSYWNSTTQQVLLIDQTLIGTNQKAQLPAGKKVKVQGVPAVFVSGIQREIAFIQLPPTPEAPVPEGGSIEPITSATERITVEDGKSLIWFTNGIRFEVFSNLPEEEILKVAESLEPAEEFTGTLPANPEPRATPLWGELHQVQSIAIIDGARANGSVLTFESVEERSLEAVQSLVDFPILLPTYLPHGYLRLQVEAPARNKLIMHFQTSPTQTASIRSFALYELAGEAGQFLGGDKVREVKLKDSKGILAQGYATESKGEGSQTLRAYLVLYWKVGELSLALYSFDLPVEEMVRVAESLVPLSSR